MTVILFKTEVKKKKNYKYILIKILYFLILILPILVNVAFITLIERKILRYAQNRKGPNKVALAGIFQPFADAIKLFTKENILPNQLNFYLFFLSPLIILILILLFWIFLPLKKNNFIIEFRIIFLIRVISLNIYPLFCNKTTHTLR